MIKPIPKYKAPKKIKKKKSNKKILQEELTELWKMKSYDLLPHKCMACGGVLSTWHHWIPKSRSLFLRYNINNSIPICKECHYILHFSSKPTEVAEIVDRIRKNMGQSWCNWIMENEYKKATNTIKWLNTQKNILENL